MSIVVSLILLPVSVYTQTQCFDRSVLTNDIVCNLNSTFSSCCAHTFKCLSNGLCAPGPDTARLQVQLMSNFYQGSCTDNIWRDAGCPKFCTSAQDTASGQGLQDCKNAGEGKFCCWRGATDCCQDRSAILDLGLADAYTTVSLAQSLSSSRLVSSTASGSVQTGASASVTTGVTYATNQWLSRTTATSASNSGVNATAIGAGVGIGVGIPIILGVIAAALLYRRRKKRQAAHAANAHIMEKPELDSWKSNVSRSMDMHNSHAGTTHQHEMDAVDRRVFELR